MWQNLPLVDGFGGCEGCGLGRRGRRREWWYPPSLADGNAQWVEVPPLIGGHETLLHLQGHPHLPEVPGPLGEGGGEGGGVAVKGGQGEGQHGQPLPLHSGILGRLCLGGGGDGGGEGCACVDVSVGCVREGICEQANEYIYLCVWYVCVDIICVCIWV